MDMYDGGIVDILQTYAACLTVHPNAHLLTRSLVCRTNVFYSRSRQPAQILPFPSSLLLLCPSRSRLCSLFKHLLMIFSEIFSYISYKFSVFASFLALEPSRAVSFVPINFKLNISLDSVVNMCTRDYFISFRFTYYNNWHLIAISRQQPRIILRFCG